MAKIWKYHPGGCDHCGNDSEIFTDEGEEEGYGYDGDPIRCVSCGAEGYWSVADKDDAYINWPETIESKYKKMMVDGKMLNVFLVGSMAEEDAIKLAELKGIEIVTASSKEFLDEYERRNGPSVAKLPYEN